MDNNDKRSELRINKIANVLIELQAGAPGDDTPLKLAVAEVIDFSANGMQVAVADELPQDNIYPLLIQVEDEPDFRLVAEVKWCRPNEDQFLAGLALLDSQQTEITQWKNLIANQLGS